MIRFILAMGAGAAVTVMEQQLTGHVTSLHRVIIAAIVIIPVAAACWYMSRRASSPAPSGTAAPRPSYSFPQPGRRS